MLTEFRLEAARKSSDEAVARLFLAAAAVASEDVVRSESAAGAVRLVVYAKDASASRRLRRAFACAGVPGWRLRQKALRSRDWFTKWQRAFRIAPLGSRFTIVPLWRKKQFKGRRLPVYIDPKGCFGSGTHETTRLVVRLMERLEGRFRTFLDAGTGTGVLLVVADRLGAEKSLGIDVDPHALRAARANLKENGVRRARLLKADSRAARLGRFDLVAANLLSRDLEDSRDRLAAALAPGGHLIVSGIERPNFRRFLRAFKDARFKKVCVLEGRTWGAALYRRL